MALLRLTRRSLIIGTSVVAGAAAIALVAGAGNPLSAGAQPGDGGAAREAKPDPADPSFVVVMTDDQRLDDLTATIRGKPLMPFTRELLVEQGVTFPRYYATYPLSCPSRVTFLTGEYSHNHGIRSNTLPGGGYCGSPDVFPTDKSLATFLDDAGYQTIIGGRYLNGYPGDRQEDTVDPGWDRWFVPVETFDTRAALFYGYRLNRDGNVTPPFPATSGNYFTDKISDLVIGAIEKTPPDTPVFAFIAHRAPHEDVVAPDGPAPARRHRQSLRFIEPPRNPAFDEADVSDKPAYFQSQKRLTPTEEARIELRAKRRLASLRSVDDGVRDLVASLKRSGRYDNTYILFISDNGFFLGEHRFPKGKVRVYEPSSRVPAILVGPGVAKGAESNELVGNIDLAPTLLDAAGVDRELDGRSLLPFGADPGLRTRRPLVIESFREFENKNLGGNARTRTPNYQSLIYGDYKVVRYVTGDRELFDLSADPFELENVFTVPRYRRVREFMLDRLRRYDDCAGSACATEIAAPPPRPAG